MAKEQSHEPAQAKSFGQRFSALVASANDKAAQSWAEMRIGDGHAAAMGRLGWKELRNALSWESRSTADSEVGLYGSATQGEIASARSETGLDAEEEKQSVLGYPLPPPDQGPDQGKQPSRGR